MLWSVLSSHRSKSVGVTRYTGNGNLWRACLVQVDLIDVGVEILIVRAECIQNRPNHLKAFVIVECIFWLYIVGHNHGDDDIAILLFLVGALTEGTHHTPYTLHHLHLAVSGREEQYGIKSGHIDTLGETTHITEHTTLLRIIGILLQPGNQFITGVGIHRTIYMLGLDIHHLFLLIIKHHVLILRVLLLGHAMIALDAFRQSIDTANNLGGIIEVQFVQFVLFGCEVIVVLDMCADFLRNVLFANRQYQYLVVGQ